MYSLYFSVNESKIYVYYFKKFSLKVIIYNSLSRYVNSVKIKQKYTMILITFDFNNPIKIE